MPIWPKLKKNLKEKIILHEVIKGDNQAFVWFYDQYAPQVYRFILLKTSSVQDSEDLCSEVFFRFWKQVSTEAAKVKNPRGFMYQIARNLVVDYYRKKSKTELIINQEQENKIANISSREADLGQKAVLISDMTQMKQALSKIKPKYQDLIIWHYLDDFSIREIAQILDKPENTVRVQVHRALKTLKSVIK